LSSFVNFFNLYNSSGSTLTDKHVSIFFPSFVGLSVHVNSHLLNWRQVAAKTQKLFTGILISLICMVNAYEVKAGMVCLQCENCVIHT